MKSFQRLCQPSSTNTAPKRDDLGLFSPGHTSKNWQNVILGEITQNVLSMGEGVSCLTTQM